MANSYTFGNDKCGFFNAELNNGEYDRVYDAESFSGFFEGIIKDGIVGDYGDVFDIEAIYNEYSNYRNTKPTINIKTGKGFLKNVWFKVDSDISLELEARYNSAPRLDTLYVKIDKGNRGVSFVVSTGEALPGDFNGSRFSDGTTVNPLAPTELENDENNGVYYYPIAYILLTNLSNGSGGTNDIKIAAIISAIGDTSRYKFDNSESRIKIYTNSVFTFSKQSIASAANDSVIGTEGYVTPYVSLPTNMLKEAAKDSIASLNGLFEQYVDEKDADWQSFISDYQTYINSILVWISDDENVSNMSSISEMLLNHINNKDENGEPITNPHGVTASDLGIYTIYITTEIPTNVHWSNDTYVVNVNGISATDYLTVDLNASQISPENYSSVLAAYSAITSITFGNNQITVTSQDPPDVPIPIKIGGVHIGS